MLNYDRRRRVEDHRVAAFFQAQLEAGESYASISAARKAIAQELGRAIAPGTPEAKAVDEAIELALVNVSRKLVKDASPLEAFDKLVDLYNRQPTLGVRSSTSARQQAYSTVLPIAYLASQLAGISKSSRVYEPTAGNGALLIGADPKSCTVNELNSVRAAQLRSQGFSVTEYDATEYLPEEKRDVVIANPPFGRVKGKRFRLPGNLRGTSQIDQAIAMKALQTMKDDGRAVLIMGGKPEIDPEQRSEAYNSLETRGFFYTLHQQYNVTDHFTINGDLYRKQGAGWPIDVIVIEGRGASERSLPAVEPPRIYNSFDELREYLNDYLRQNLEFRRLRQNEQGLDTAESWPSLSRENPRRLGNADPGKSPGANETSIGLDDAGVATIQHGQDGAAIHAGQHLEATSFDSRASQSDGRRQRGETTLGLGDQLGRESPRVQSDLGGMVSSNQPRASVSYQPDKLQSARGRDRDAQRIHNRGIPDGDENPIPVEQTQESVMSEELNISYRPRSRGRSPGTLIPTNMAVAAQKALDNIEQAYGNIDTFVQQRLGYGSKAEMYERLYAEQIDSLALAFDQKDRGRIFLNGDQTGNGKGRFGAANIVDAKRQGYIPVFVTQKPNLYAAMLEDLSDIGFDELRPFMTNSQETLRLPSGNTLKTGSVSSQNDEMYRISQSDTIGGYDVIFTTYNQLQTVSNEEPFRREFLRAIAPNAVFIFDEAHEAGGSQSESWENGPPNRAAFVRELVDTAAGAVFMSATATKHPAVMDLYARRTDATYAVPSMSQLESTLKAGGIPLQQMMASQFVSAGNMLRRERSFDNISFEAKEVSVDHELADAISTVMRSIDRFDEAKQESIKALRKEVKKEAKQVSQDNSIGKAGVSSVSFTSLMHNAIDQGLLSQKAEATIQEAIAALKRGEKPLVALSNTMDSFISTYAKEQGIKPGDEMNVTFGDVLNRYLERSRDVNTKDYSGQIERIALTDEQLGPEAIAAFEEARETIAATDFSKIPLSSIDYMKHRLTQEGYRVDEITGRSNIIQYGDEGLSYAIRSNRESSAQAKIDIVDRFNSGQLDVVILNRSGATGISLHASEKFSDQRPRHMIVAQAERDINQMMQMLGRANRFGQVVEPRFTLVMANVPAEKRLGAILAKKMASLNANTTAGRESDLSVGNVVDIMNVAGEEVVSDLLESYPELEAMLSYPNKGQLSGDTALIERVTGRIPLLPIANQANLYAIIEAETKALIEQKEAMGENVLRADQLDLDARTISIVEVEPADAGIVSEFTGPVMLEIVDAKAVHKPPTQLQVINMIRTNLEQSPIESLDEHNQTALEDSGLVKGIQAIDALKPHADAYKQAAIAKSKSAENTAKQIKTLDQQLEKFEETVRQFSPGESVELMSKDGKVDRISYGVVVDFEAKSRSMGSPAAPSNWSLKVVTHQGKLLSIPFSKINNGKSSGVSLAARTETFTGKNIYQEFDRLQQAQRTQMQIFTGNLLKAYEKFPKGKFVNFTNSEGQTRQGLLMDEEFDIVEKLQELPVEFKAPEQLKVFIEELTQTRGVIESSDGSLKLHADNASRLSGDKPEYYVLRVPSSTKQGGKYFLNESLTHAADSEFFSIGDRMEMKVAPEDLDEVAKVLMGELKTKLLVLEPNYKEILRNYLGETLPTLQTVEPDSTIEVEQPQAHSEVKVEQSVVAVTTTLTPPSASTPQLEEAIVEGRPKTIAEVQSEATTPIDQALPPAPSKGTISDVDKDTVEQAIAKDRSEDIIKETQLSLLSTEASVIQTESIKPQVAESDLNPNPEPAIAKDKSETFSQGQSVVTAQVLPPSQQGSQAAKNVAKLLHDAGLQSFVLKGEDFHLRAEQDHFLPFVIERHHNYDSHQDQLYLTHYNSMNGDQFIDAEVVFNIGDRGNLSLAETASFNPFTGGELRSRDQSFAKLFSGNLLAQGWAQAISKTREDLKAETVETKVLKPRSPEPPILDAVQQPNSNNIQDGLNPKDWPIVAAAVGRNPDYIERVRQVVQSPLQAPTQSAMQKDFAVYQKTLEGLREWYAHARAIQKPSLYLHEIHAIATKFQAGEKLKPEIRALARQDWSELHFKKYSRGVHHSPDTFLKDVANNALTIGLDAQNWKAMSFKDISDILIQGNPGLRDTFKLHREGTTRYVKTTLVEVIKQLPQEKRKVLLKSDPAYRQNLSYSQAPKQTRNRGPSL